MTKRKKDLELPKNVEIQQFGDRALLLHKSNKK
jgi:hypothetical protein